MLTLTNVFICSIFWRFDCFVNRDAVIRFYWLSLIFVNCTKLTVIVHFVETGQTTLFYTLGSSSKHFLTYDTSCSWSNMASNTFGIIVFIWFIGSDNPFLNLKSCCFLINPNNCQCILIVNLVSFLMSFLNNCLCFLWKLNSMKV